MHRDVVHLAVCSNATGFLVTGSEDGHVSCWHLLASHSLTAFSELCAFFDVFVRSNSGRNSMKALSSSNITERT